MEQNKQSTNPLPTTFYFHEDAGHGWLAVPRAVLQRLNIEKEITGYSYQKDDVVYLEEDFDASTFSKTYLQYIGRDVKDFAYFRSLLSTIYDGDQSPIRQYQSFSVTSK